MKKMIIAVLLFSCIMITGLYGNQSQQVIDLPGLPKGVIYSKSIDWVTTSFVSAKAILEMQDPSQGKIVGNIIVHVPVLWSKMGVTTRLIIETQDNKARITLIQIGDEMHKETHTERIIGEYKKLADEFKVFVSRKEDKW